MRLKLVVTCLALAAGLAAAEPAAEPPKLEGERLETLLRLRAEAAEARVAHLAAVAEAQELIRKSDKLAREAQDAAARLDSFGRAQSEAAGCVLRLDGGWQCEEGQGTGDKGQE